MYSLPHIRRDFFPLDPVELQPYFQFLPGFLYPASWLEFFFTGAGRCAPILATSCLCQLCRALTVPTLLPEGSHQTFDPEHVTAEIRLVAFEQS
jgi:hypothetical protein